jgi:hypothetical protein
MSKPTQRIVLVLCLAAGIFYNSWPLGYLLDIQTARHGLASDLELVGHPYYWLFILGDLLTAVCVISTVVILRLRLWSAWRSNTKIYVAGGLLLFGLFTGVSAFLPSQCTVTPVLRCGAGQGTGLGLDALTSSLAALGLLISLIGLVLECGNKLAAHPLTRITQVTLAAWSASGLLFVVLALTNGNAHFSQNILLIMSGIALFVIGLDIDTILITK